MIRRLAAASALAAGLLVPSAPPAGAHTYEAAKAACDWVEVRIWGPNPNGVTRLRNAPVHLWGSHQADCRYGDIGLDEHRLCILVDLITGVEGYLGDCYV